MARHRDEERREQAFLFYKKHRCNLTKVSNEPDMPAAGTLIRWKREDNWDERLQKQRSDLSEFAGLLKAGQGLPALENDIHELKILEVLERYAGEQVELGNIKPESWKDILETLKYVSSERKLLMGKPTGRTEVQHSTTPGTPAEHKQMIEFLEEAQRIIRSYQSPVAPLSDEKIVASGKPDGSNSGSSANSS